MVSTWVVRGMIACRGFYLASLKKWKNIIADTFDYALAA